MSGIVDGWYDEIARETDCSAAATGDTGDRRSPDPTKTPPARAGGAHRAFERRIGDQRGLPETSRIGKELRRLGWSQYITRPMSSRIIRMLWFL